MNEKRVWNPFNCDMLSEIRGCMSPNKCEYAEECKHNWQFGDWVKYSELKEIVNCIPSMNTIGTGDESKDGIHSFRYCNGWNDCLRFVKKVLNI